jgi:hypothetical protein
VETAATGMPLPLSASTAVVDADRAGGDAAVGKAERGLQILAQRLARLGAETPHAAFRVVAVERRQVDAFEGAHQPSRLPFLLDRAAPAERSRPALGRGEIDAHRLDRVHREGNAGIGRMRARIARPGFGAHSRRTPDDSFTHIHL